MDHTPLLTNRRVELVRQLDDLVGEVDEPVGLLVAAAFDWSQEAGPGRTPDFALEVLAGRLFGTRPDRRNGIPVADLLEPARAIVREICSLDLERIISNYASLDVGGQAAVHAAMDQLERIQQYPLDTFSLTMRTIVGEDAGSPEAEMLLARVGLGVEGLESVVCAALGSLQARRSATFAPLPFEPGATPLDLLEWYTVVEERISEALGVPTAIIASVLDLVTTRWEGEHSPVHPAVPGPDPTFRRRPLLALPTGQRLLVMPLLLLPAVVHQVDALLLHEMGERYTRRRGQRFEQTVADVLSVGPGTRIEYTNVPWRSDTLQGELDVVASIGEVTIVAEAKAGSAGKLDPQGRAPQSAARRTADSDLFRAVDQFRRLEQALEAGPFESEATHFLRTGSGRLRLHLAITLHDLGTQAGDPSRVAQLTGGSGGEEPVLWFSLRDLRVITEFLQGPRLAAYLLWRRTWTLSSWLPRAADELGALSSCAPGSGVAIEGSA